MKEKGLVSRRGFLKGIVQSVSMVALVKFSKIVPEARALVGAKAGKGTRLPKNATVKEMEGNEADQLIEKALQSKDSLQLQSALQGFNPQPDSAEVATFFVTWRDEETKKFHRGPVASIPFSNDIDNKAYLYYCKINGDA